MTSTTPIRVLVVDDEPNVLRQLEATLIRKGFLVRTCRSGDEGLRLALSEPFDVALVDVRMPGMGGVDVMHELRRSKPAFPVVLMSGYTDVDSQAMIAEGASAWMDKPFSDPDKVCDTLRKVSGKK